LRQGIQSDIDHPSIAITARTLDVAGYVAVREPFRRASGWVVAGHVAWLSMRTGLMHALMKTKPTPVRKLSILWGGGTAPSYSASWAGCDYRASSSNFLGDGRNWRLRNQPRGGAIRTCAKLAGPPEIVVWLTQLRLLSASSSPARGAPRPLRPYRPFDKEAAHSPAGFVATMCIRGRGGTTMRIGGPC
jgi:hypothetical protein